MKLKEVNIRNYRSIEDLTLEFNPRCRVLVGINESGKTNILDSLSLLDDNIPPTRQDKRIQRLTEDPVRESFVKFVFSFDKGEKDSIWDNFWDKVYAVDEHSKLAVNANGEKVTLFHFASFISNEGLYNIDIFNENKRALYWGLNQEYNVLNNWKKVKDGCPDNIEIMNKDGDKYQINKFSLININDATNDIADEYLEPCAADFILKLVGNLIIEHVNENKLECLFWKYEGENILPPSVNLEQFSANPEICSPLKIMFILADYNDVHARFEEAKQEGELGISNLLRVVAKKTTNHFRSVWKEYNNVEFELTKDGDNIRIAIKDKYDSVSYIFQQRSDGFKRFVTFLLMISARERKNLLRGTLLLIDEPDIMLHPKGSKYLRDELLKISKTNYLVYSTHSIFMIDKNNINRHLIVKKEEEVTEVVDVNESTIVEEEVLYKALGYSIFEELQEMNIIFEGWRDKKLFKKATSYIIDKYKKVKEIKRYGVCFVHGVSDIRHVVPLLEMANRKYVIVSDNDTPAKNMQKEYKELGHEGKWLRYDEINPNCEAITGEDFIKNEAFEKPIQEMGKELGIAVELNIDDLEHPKGKIYKISQWLNQAGINSTEDKSKAIKKIKAKVFEGLKYTQIKESYYEVLRMLLEKIKVELEQNKLSS